MPSIPDTEWLLALFNNPLLWNTIQIVAGITAVVFLAIRYQNRKRPTNKREQLKQRLDEIVQEEQFLDALKELAQKLEVQGQKLENQRLEFDSKLESKLEEFRKQASESKEEEAPDSEPPVAPASAPKKSSGLSIVPIPRMGAIAARPRKESLYDREIVPDNQPHASEMRFFQRTYQFMDGTCKTRGDTNLVGNGGSIPRGHLFMCYGLSLAADSSMSEAQFNEILDNASITFLLGATPYAEYPARRVLTRDASKVMVDTTVSKKPLQLVETECFGIRLDLSNVKKTEKIGIMAIMHGIYLKPLTG